MFDTFNEFKVYEPNKGLSLSSAQETDQARVLLSLQRQRAFLYVCISGHDHRVVIAPFSDDLTGRSD